MASRTDQNNLQRLQKSWPPEIPSSCDTIPKLFRDRVERFGARIAMREKDRGIWQPVTWREYGAAADKVGAALLAMGLPKGGRAAVTAEVCQEWLYTDLGIMQAGGISFGIYPTDTPQQIEYIMNDCAAEIYFAEDDEQLDKILEVRDHIPSLKKIIVFDWEGLHALKDPMVMPFEEFLKMGEAHLQETMPEMEARAKSAKADETAILVYTSGTTGPPKGAMLSHQNIIFMGNILRDVLPLQEDDKTLAFLPLCHIAERTFTTFSQLMSGQVVHFAESTDAAMSNLREVRPTSFFAVPRIWEKIYAQIAVMVKEATYLERLIYDWALKVGMKRAEYVMESRPVPLPLALLYRAAQFLVFSNIRKMIGIDRARYVLSGAAPISPELIKWYYALGLYMVEGYGQTESTGIATLPVPWGSYQYGSIGKALPKTEVKISPEGEILLKGRHVFQGYWSQEQKTSETIMKGWLHTGDVGVVDNQGWIKITGRIKDIIITAGGKNITPSEIENALKFSPYIADAVVVGDARKYLTALIMIDHDNIAKFAQDESVPFSDFASLCRAAPIVDLIQSEVHHANRLFAPVEQIKKFRLIDRIILPEDDEITATGKLKRSFVSEKYKDLIDSMYDGG